MPFVGAALTRSQHRFRRESLRFLQARLAFYETESLATVPVAASHLPSFVIDRASVEAPKNHANESEAEMAKLAMLLGQEYEDSEVRIPLDLLREAGHDVVIVGVKAGETLRGKNGEEEVEADRSIEDVLPREFAALVIPGGKSPAHLREDARVVEFVKSFVATTKPIAAVCHGPQLLVEANAVRGKKLTSWPEIREEMETAGAVWVDREVVEDGALITSRKPADLEAFSNALLARLEAPAKMKQEQRAQS